MDTFRNTWRFGVADKVRSDCAIVIIDRHTTSVKHTRAKLLRHRRERKGDFITVVSYKIDKTFQSEKQSTESPRAGIAELYLAQ